MPFSSTKFYIFLKPDTSRGPFSVQQLIINFFPPNKVDYPDINKSTFFLKAWFISQHCLLRSSLLQNNSLLQSARMFSYGERNSLVEELRNQCFYLWKRDLFQAQLLDTDAAETMTVLEQSSQGEVSTYSISGQQHAGKMRPSRSQLRIYKLNKRISYWILQDIEWQASVHCKRQIPQ